MVPDFNPARNQADFYRQVYHECRAMANFALSSGLNLTPNLAANISAMFAQPQPSPKTTASEEAEPPAPEAVTLPLQKLVELHLEMTQVVAPATPRSILLMAQEENSRWRFLGSVPLVRQMMLLALGSLAGFILVGLSPDVTVDQVNVSILNQSGLPLFLNEAFLLCAAALGASFANLFEANRYCTRGTYDPKFNSSYWVRYVLGVIAGLILSELLSSEIVMGGAQPGADAANSAVANLASTPMLKPTLAMLGGFSSDLVVRILNRLISSIETMLSGDPREQTRTHIAAARDQAILESDRDKVVLARELAEMKSKLAQGSDPTEASKQLDDILSRLTKTKIGS